MKTDLQDVMAIKDVRLEHIMWNGQELERHRVVTDGTRAYGIVSPQYKPVAHSTVLARVQEFLPEGTVENVYTDRGLARVVFNIQLPKVYKLDGDSEIKTYVNLRNSLDGSWPIGLVVSPVRVVCQNTFVLHLKEAFIKLSERHREVGVQRFFNEVPIVTKVYNALEGQLQVAQELMKLSVTTERGQEFLKQLIEKKIVAKRVGERAAEVFAHPTRKEDEARNMWTLFNATTDVLTRSLEEKGRLSTMEQLYTVGETFSALVNVR